jgi:CelD/BcsL family acetyltransferase involved in cellulose biosynthesis
VKVDLHTTTDIFGALKNEWNALLKHSCTDTPFNTWEWHRHWWDAYHPGAVWVMTVRDDDQQLVGIASFFIETTADDRRLVHFIGCEDVTDYLDIVAHRDHHTAVYEALADALIEQRDQYDALDLCNIPQDSPTYTQFPQLLRDKGFTAITRRQDVCPVVPLPATFDEYLQSLDKKQRKEVQRKLRRAKGQGDSLQWYIVDDTHDLHAELDKFLLLMESSHPEKAEFLQDQQHIDFFKAIVPAAYDAGWLQLNILEVAGDPVAAYLNFDYNNKVLIYNSGLEPHKAAALSPGIVLLAYNIQHAIDQQRDVVDFLRGDERYKYLMGGQDTEIFNLQAHYSV